MQTRIIITFLIVLFSIASLHSQIPPQPNFTPEETARTIQRLTTGSEQKIRHTYEKGILVSTEWQQEWPLHYMRYYHDNGTLHSHGLMGYYTNLGTWEYFDRNGRLLKTADYNTMTQQLEPGVVEPYTLLLNKAKITADSLVVAFFGQQFVTQFKVTCTNRYYEVELWPYEREWLDVQDEYPPRSFTFYYAAHFDDTIEVDLIILHLGPDGKLKEDEALPPLPSDTGAYAFKVHYDLALTIARNIKFDYVGKPELSRCHDGFCWSFRTAGEGTANNSTYEVLEVDASSGQVSRYFQTAFCDHCEPVTYRRTYEDSSVIPPGYKRINAQGIYLNVPDSWIGVEEYGKSGKYSNTHFWYNGTDTLHLSTSNGMPPLQMKMAPMLRLSECEYQVHAKVLRNVCARSYYRDDPERGEREFRECQRISDSIYLADSTFLARKDDSTQRSRMRIRDSIAHAAAMKKQLEDSLETSFVAGFPEGKMQGRKVSILVESPGDKNPWWSITMEVNNDHGGFGVNQTNYFFTADHLSEEQFYRMYSILRSARFLSY